VNGMSAMRQILFFFMALLTLINCSEPTRVLQHSPVIHSIAVDRSQVYPQEFVTVQAVVSDQDKTDRLTFHWTADGGTFTNFTNNPTQWHAPSSPATCTLKLTVSDGVFQVADSTTVKVVPR